MTIEAGERKANLPLSSAPVLGFFGGAFIALGFLLDIRVTGDLPATWGSFGGFLGASVFPVGLILVVMAGAYYVAYIRGTRTDRYRPDKYELTKSMT